MITAGGRSSKDAVGIRELAEVLADAGHQVLIWDRVTCGESDISFAGATESLMNAAVQAGLLATLDFGPTLLVGGSAGSRVSLLTAIRHPERVAGLFLLWVSGGALGLAGLANYYHYESALAAMTGGMEAVAELPMWQEQVARNEANRAQILAQEPYAFVETMQRWAWAFFPKSDAPVPGLDPEELAAIKVPTIVLRNGVSDLFHTKATSEALARMIPTAVLQPPPWGEHEWNEGSARGEAGGHPWGRWYLLAPQIIALSKRVFGTA
jgi:pimeloyl-ACP methyl ester carboxylesterase